MYRSHRPELLDAERISQPDLDQNLRDIARLNRLTGTTTAMVGVVDGLIAGVVDLDGTKSRTWTLLDLGTGAGDLPYALRHQFRRHGLSLQIVGGDIHAGVLDFARRHSTAANWLQLDATRLSLADCSVDVVLCVQTAHHIDPEPLRRMLLEMRRVSRVGFMIMDLQRSLLTRYAISLLVQLVSNNRLTRHDGPLSAERAYKSSEVVTLAQTAGIVLTVRPVFPFRWIATWKRQ